MNYKISHPEQYPIGETIITRQEDKYNTQMDFIVLKLAAGEEYINEQPLERAYLLLTGECAVSGSVEGNIRREDIFRQAPPVIHVASGERVHITAIEQCEICLTKTRNEKAFASKIYQPHEVRDERRGAGTMQETSTRIVRTVFDYSNAPDSNLVLGEVIAFPGKWSSYPPHHHPQPEIYFYKFLPENGMGVAALNDDLEMVRHNDTIIIPPDTTHPQGAMPGYAMYYLWVIRHLPDNPYITPVFIPEHAWVQSPDADIFNG